MIDFLGKGGNQYWEYNGEIYRDNYCVTYEAHDLMTKHCRKSDKQVNYYQTLFTCSDEWQA